MKNIAIYIRVSTQEQAKEGYSIPAQRDKLLSFCKAKNWLVYDIYIDDGYTGTNLNRPGLKSLLADLDKIDGVLVYKLDRLSRSQKDVLYLVEEIFLENNVDFISILESFDTTTAFGKAMIGILAVFAQLERDTIVERSKLGKERRAKEGKWRGGPLPLGYDYINKKLVINEYEANIVRKIFDMYIKGNGMDSIAKTLNSEGYRSKKEASFSSSKINTYLNNTLYIGMNPYKGVNFEGDHKSIIDKKTFKMAQDIMKERGKSFRKTSDALLGGLLICGNCGAKMFRRKINNYYYYTCYSYHGSPSHMVTSENCDIGYINCSKLEEEVLNQFEFIENIDDMHILDTYINNLIELNKVDNIPSINKLNKELLKVEQELSRWYYAYGKGEINYNDVVKKIEETSTKKIQLQDQISIVKENNCQSNKEIIYEQLNSIIKDFKLIWINANNTEKKIILKGFIDSITVYKNKPSIIRFRSS